MQRYIGLDVHAASSTLAVVSETGKRLRSFPVETNGRALVEAIRLIPGRRHVVLEEGTQSAWLYETLAPYVEEIVVAGVTTSRGQKNDAIDLSSSLRSASERQPSSTCSPCFSERTGRKCSSTEPATGQF